MKFKLHSNYQPRGDQPAAIDQLYVGVEAGEKHQMLLGVTGSSKTFTIAKLIEQANRPALVLAHNKTLAAQLYHEFKDFFPENAVEYFVSYYDFYQPEAYVPSADIYIDKEATINDELDKLRMSTTRSLFERRDVVIVASVSCISGIGSPEAYYGMLVTLEKGQQTSREALLRRLVDIQYERSEDLRRGTFRVRGDMIEIYPPYQDEGFRLEMWGEQIDTIRQIDPLTGEMNSGQEDLPRVTIFPKTHYVMPQEQRDRAIVTIQEELWWWKKELEKQGKFVEAQRVVQRTMFDIEMNRTRRSVKCAECSMGTVRASRRWWTTAFECLRPWITVLSRSRSLSTGSIRWCMSRQPPERMNSPRRAAWSSSRSFVRPDWSTRKWKFVPSKDRWMTCWKRFACARRRTSAFW